MSDLPPVFKPGTRVRISGNDNLDGVEAEVVSAEAFQRIGGGVGMFLYTLRLDNLALVKVYGHDLTPIAGQAGKE